MGSAVRPDDTALPPLHRILTPDEFHQAQGMSPEALASRPFPVIPPIPAAPRDVTRTPNDPNTKGTPQTGLARILTQRVAQPIMDHPLTGVLTATIPGAGYVMGGLMAKNVIEYAAQKAAESTLPPDVKKMAEGDPTRISGEEAAVNAALLGVAPLVHAALKGAGGVGDVSKGVTEAGAAGVSEMGGVAPRAPVSGEAPNAMLDAAGTERYSGLPVTPELRAAIGQHVTEVSDAWNKIFAPANRSPEAKSAANILRATTGEMARSYEQAAFKLDEFRRAVEPLPESDKLGFIDAIEGGKSQPSPEFQKAADTIRETLDSHREAIQQLGTGKLEHFIQDYFPHIWTDPERAADTFKGDATQAQIGAIGGKRPMEGGKSFLKQRTIPTTLEGIQAGLEPVSYNPVDLTLLKLREMQRYLMAHNSLNEMKDAGLVKFVRSGDQAPDGYQRINDKIATVFGPRKGAVSLPEGANVAPEDVGVYGMRIMGEHWAPEPVATVVNNYLSPGLRGNALFDAYRGLGNTLNQAQLGLSAFHLGFTSIDASVSRTALGLEYLSEGKLTDAAKKIASAPTAGLPGIVQGTLGDFMNARFGTDLKIGLGAKIRHAYFNPDEASPEFQALASAYAEGGGRARMDSFYKTSAPEKMIAAWREGGLIGKGKALAYSPGAVLEYAAKPIMEHIVPLQKMQVFGEIAQKALADLPPDATLADRRAALSSVVDNVDNRLGQMVYDNLFWNKTFKDIAMGSVRSVGWNLGTIRELGGGIVDVGKRVTGQDAKLSRAGFYAMALPAQLAVYGAVYQYLRTGEGPSELKDYYFPKTGDVDADGNPERVQLPSYMKDVFAYAGAPWTTVKHKVSPILASTVEMLNNEDYYGDEIRNPDDPMVKQVQQEFSYLGKSVIPFGIRNAMESSARGDQSVATKYGTEIGITPAPREKVRSTAQNLMAGMLKHAPSGATPEEAEGRQARAELLAGLRLGKDETDKIDQAIQSGNITAPQIGQLLKRVGLTPAQEKYKRLTFAQAVQVFNAGTDQEKALFASTLLSKAQRVH
jgi:hypothetical protein